MVNIELQEGQIVASYRHYKNDEVFEGHCILVEKISEDDTFYVDGEELVPKSFDLSSSSLNKTSGSTKRRIKLVRYLDLILANPSPTIRKFSRAVKSVTNRDITSYNRIYSIVESYKKKYDGSNNSIKNILLIDSTTLSRYFQQKYIQGWRPSLYRSEKWVVEFYPQTHNGVTIFNSPFRTSRRFKILVKIAPQDEGRGRESLCRLTTYNGMSSLNAALEY